MRHLSVWGAVALFLLHGAPAHAQAGRDVRFVNADRAEVRSGPSDSGEFYVTNQLRRGQPVEVIGEEAGGWLAIKPPEGSFSYINTRFIRHMDKSMPTHVVTLDGVKVPIYTGSEVVNKRPSVVGAWLEPGAQVVSRGNVVVDEDGSWMPIEAPARERRFLRASLVVKSAQDASQLVRASASAPGGAALHSSFTPSQLPPSAAPSANEMLSPEQMWRKAEQAERSGQLAEAIRLYAMVGAETAQTQPSVSTMALQRARYLQGGYKTYGTTVSVSGGGPSTAVQVGAPTAPRTAGPPPAPARQQSSFVGTPPRTDPRNGSTRWVSYRGVLRDAGRVVEGQATYVLDDPSTFLPILYVTPGRGLDLRAHLNRIVTVSGYAFYRGDVRNNYMTAVRLEREP